MRNLIVGCLLTLDGVHEAPRNWAGPFFDAAAAQESLEQLNRSDAMLMGRNTYEYFASAWPYESGPYPDRVNAIRKYVFSSTLQRAEWNNAVLIDEDPVSAVRRLKREGDGDLVIYGFGRLSHALLARDLVDEVRLTIYPVLQGGGETMPRLGGVPTRLSLVSVERSESGVVSLDYRKPGSGTRTTEREAPRT
ncbi:dihydrofolate reductase family protein [Cryptosporangium minutisporangium]|uniref:Dihydrofolate reductase family protein n=1 Tax=Cryptosporangium minutisporangium TaxID=113569 RepID=A0ABP6SSL2_9ACTN